MKLQLIILRWLPASWKSTIANNLVETMWFKRVNKDDLRQLVDCWKYSKQNEQLIDEMEMALADLCLINWYNVVIDDTNLSDKRIRYIKDNLVSEWKVDVIEQFVNTSVDECIQRDRARWNKRVWDNVILNMYDKFINK